MGHDAGHHTDVRLAAEHDIAELVRLRQLLFEDLGGDFFNPSSGDDDWRDALAEALKERLTADAVRILVVEAIRALPPAASAPSSSGCPAPACGTAGSGR
ncbi:hypothetical protein ACH4U7_21215 [Streptomyces sp. NPDC020845]|uniref:hypothetical protein n=1 Tax=Streptomyces sp. NPDC020845 TaxID=3365096 RepID=UPI00378BA6D6